MKISFICLGNICRSPMAEYICKDMIKKENKTHLFQITSAGTSGYHDGEDMHPKTKQQLKIHNIDNSCFVSKKIDKALFDSSDIIFVMDDSNFENVTKQFGFNLKIKKITDYSSIKKITYVPDPWYTNNFDETYEILTDCISNFLKSIN